MAGENKRIFRKIRNWILICLLLPVSINSAFAMTYRDNVVAMPIKASGYTNVTATYTITDFSVTNGQDPNHNIHKGLANTYAGNNGSMTFRVGRKGSSGVANWFSSRIRASQTTFDHNPGDLNFAFIGTLKMTLTGGVLGRNQDTYTIQGVGIAQGHVALRNNWWFGGRSCKYTGNNKVTCDGTSSSGYTVQFVFHRGGNSVNEIALESVVYPPYRTTSLLSPYQGESTQCKWQPASKCPPYVIYYNGTQRASLKLTVRNGKLYNSRNMPFDTRGADPSHSGQPAAIFVMSPDGDIYASNVNVVYLFHHSTILAGTPVAAAGELSVTNGVIQWASNCSGHYRPGAFIFEQLEESLKRQGYSQDYRVRPCSP